MDDRSNVYHLTHLQRIEAVIHFVCNVVGFFVLVPTGLAIDRHGPLPVLRYSLQASVVPRSQKASQPWHPASCSKCKPQAGVLLGAIFPNFWCQLLSRALLGGSFSVLSSLSHIETGNPKP